MRRAERSTGGRRGSRRRCFRVITTIGRALHLYLYKYDGRVMPDGEHELNTRCTHAVPNNFATDTLSRFRQFSSERRTARDSLADGDR